MLGDDTVHLPRNAATLPLRRADDIVFEPPWDSSRTHAVAVKCGLQLLRSLAVRSSLRCGAADPATAHDML